MTINEIMKKKNITKYRLSKNSGIPYSTLTDIISGKATLADLEAYALSKGEVTDSLTSGGQEQLESIMNNIMFNL